jgi:hypothetical protein
MIPLKNQLQRCNRKNCWTITRSGDFMGKMRHVSQTRASVIRGGVPKLPLESLVQRFGARLDMKLVVNIVDVFLDGLLADEKLCCYFFV